MNTDSNNNSHQHDLPNASGPDVSTAPSGDVRGEARVAEQAAREQFVHGLLAFNHHDTPGVQRARVARVMVTIAGSEVAESDVRTHAPNAGGTRVVRRGHRFAWRVGTGFAAAAVLMVCGLMMWPSTPTAMAMVQGSIEAAKQAGDRRYELRAARPGEQVASATSAPIAVIDIRGENRYFIDTRTPQGGRAFFGKDAEGEWSVREGDKVDRERRAAPLPPRQDSRPMIAPHTSSSSWATTRAPTNWPLVTRGAKNTWNVGLPCPRPNRFHKTDFISSACNPLVAALSFAAYFQAWPLQFVRPSIRGPFNHGAREPVSGGFHASADPTVSTTSSLSPSSAGVGRKVRYFSSLWCVTLTEFPLTMSPRRRCSARGSSMWRSTARRIGRAP